MAREALEMRLTRKGRHEVTLGVDADPRNIGELRQVLTGWLDGEGWDVGRWGEFEATVFAAGSSRRVARVRP